VTDLPAVRTSEAEREQAVAVLREHCVAGRLTLEEFSGRLDEAYGARTRSELELVTRELPVHASPARRRRGWMVTLFGSDQRQGRWPVPERIVAISILGSPDLDFRQAVIGSETVRITSFALMGSLTAIVPAGIEIDLGGFCMFGGNDLFDKGAPNLPGGPTLKIRSFSLFGGTGIKRVRAGSEP
jgi:hypothetical protein